MELIKTGVTQLADAGQQRPVKKSMPISVRQI
jgi:hypothetical protein